MCSSRCPGPRKALRGRISRSTALLSNPQRASEPGFKAQLSWWEGPAGTLERLGATPVEPLNSEHAAGRAGPPRPGDLDSDRNQIMLSLRAPARGPALGPLPCPEASHPLRVHWVVGACTVPRFPPWVLPGQGGLTPKPY